MKWSDISRRAMSWDETNKYCEDIGGRMPTISELRSLIKDCQATESGGECGVIDSCLSANCRNDMCDGCSFEENKNYSKLGDADTLWSSSLNDIEGYVWSVSFVNASLDPSLMQYSHYVRCLDAKVCLSNHETKCYDDNIYWYDSCGNKESLKENCVFGCEAGKCKTDPNERWKDYDTGLSWSIASPGTVTWDESIGFCNELGDNWRVPTISELRTLIRDCSGTVTGGECAVTDSCLNNSCYGDACSCSNSFAGYSKIPGDLEQYWSSSVNTVDSSIAFFVLYMDGGIYADSKTQKIKGMCVR